ncbi:hypothetical protein DFH07DRAFT_1066103 [Mycena maculata]|uniref:MYND-type domain-containing protein n=1 Tax=Mycena maculata TaxID=230809 RepID=A0AAD7HWB9_9AGAR|nr:hypothetical protein DFH07DRAFT_1066103 [Mycena maculata]
MHASLRLNNISRLPEPTQTLATSAANGSTDDLKKLLNLIPDSPHADLRLFLPAFYANLDVDDIPDLRRQLNTDSGELSTHISCAVLAVKGLAELQEHLVSRACSEVWSTIWTWIQFLEECEQRRPSESRNQQLIITTILSLRRDPETALTIKNTPGVRAVFTKGWVAAVDDPNTPRELMIELCKFVVEDMNAQDPRNSQELIEGAGGVDGLAALIVKHIRRAIPQTDYTLDPHDGLALLAAYEILQKGPLAHSLANHGIVKAVSTALCALCGPEMVMTEQMIPLSVGTIMTHIAEFPGYPWVQEGLDSGLLRGVVLCASRRMPLIDLALYALFRETLPRALVYHSTLSSLRAAIDDAQPFTNTEAFRRSTLFDEWNTFVALAEERLAVMEKFDRGEIGQTRACDHLECGAIRTDDTLLRCGACRSAFYCSQACQAADWSAGHRKACRTYLKRENEECTHLSFRDHTFLRALVHHDYDAARAEVLVRQAGFLRAHPAPGALGVVAFDYRRGRPQIEVGPAAAAADPAERGARAVRSGGRVEIHVVLVSEGGQRSRGHFVPFRSSDGRVQERVAAIAASEGMVTAEVVENDGVLALEVARTH